MSRNQTLKDERNQAIRKAYKELASKVVKTKDGKQTELYRHAAILAMLSKKYYLEPDTIERIVNEL